MLWHFYEILCTYPFRYTAGMCDVTYIGVYNIFLHGKCFLSALYNDIICLAPPQSTLLFVSSDSSSHAYATSQSCSLCADQHHTSCRNTTCSVFASEANTSNTAIVFFGRPVLWMLHFQWTELGGNWTWSAPWSATSSHISFLRVDNEFANENFTEIFVRHFAATWLVYKKCVQNGHVC